MKLNLPPNPNLVSVKTLQPYLNHIEMKTGRLSSFFKNLEQPQDYFLNPSNHITQEEWLQFIASAFEFLKDPMMTLHAIESSPLWWPEALFFILKTSENLKEGFQKVFGYRKLFHSSANAGFEETSHEVKLILSKNKNQNGPNDISDFIAGSWLKAARQALYDPNLKPIRVLMNYDRPKHWKEIEEYFEAPVYFSSERSELHFSNSDMERPLPDRDAFLASLITQHIQSILKSHSVVSGFFNQVESLVIQSIKDPALSAAKIAAQIPMSERSFYRRLSQEDLSFQKIHDSVRCSLAKKYLTESNKLFAEISFLIGFAEVSSFSRSFKRWTGQSPSEYRQLHRGQAKSPSL